MRILFFCYTEFGLVGGVETVVLTMAKNLSKQGHITGIVDLGPGWKPRHLTHGDTPIWTIAGPSFPTLRRPRSWASYLRALWQFRAICHEFEPDIIHVHFPLGQCLPMTAAHMLPHRWRSVTTVHGSDIWVCPVGDPRLQVWQSRLFKCTDAVTSVSQSLLEETSCLYPCVSAKGRVIYNGIDPQWFNSALVANTGSDKFVLFVGRLHAVKAVDVLLHAWSRIHVRLPKTKLRLAGDGGEREKLKAIALNLGIESAVEFLGEKSPAELQGLYRDALLVVLPSRHEGLGMVLLEAGACGAICVGTRVTGISEVIIDGVTGFLVEPQSPDALADAILRAANLMSDERQRMSQTAKARVRTQFDQEVVITKYLDLYRALLGPMQGENRVSQRQGS